MRLIDIVNGPWAITPAMLEEIQGIYATHLRGEKINIPDVEATIGRKLDNSHEGFEVQDGVAIIPVQGVISKRMNLFTRISGGVSTQLLQRDIAEALDDPKVKAIILDADSPGGSVDGTAEVSEYIYKSRGKKPIVTHTDGTIASAMYWIASATDSIYISGNTNAVGSIGVVAAHRDYSEAEKRSGIKTTEITAGKYKRISSQYEPLTAEGRADIQAKVDYLYSAFVDTVARNRGTSVEQVLENMADGQVFIGTQAVDNGLVDGVSTLDDLIDELAAGGSTTRGNTKTARAAGVAESAKNQKGKAMTKEELKAQHPELYQSVLDEGKEQVSAETATQAEQAKQDAATATQENLVALAGAVFGADSGDKFAKVVASGVTAEQVKALGGLTASESEDTADQESRAGILSALQNAGNKPVDSGKESPEGAAEGKDFLTLVSEHKKEHGCTQAAAMSACIKEHPKAHQAYIKSANEKE